MKDKIIAVAVVLLFSGVVFADELNTESSKSTESLELLESSGESTESSANQITKSAESTAFIELGDMENIYVERDGGFVGVDLGYSMIAWQAYHWRFQKDETPQSTENIKDKNVFGVSYGIVAGYKHFFNEYIGARYYARFGANHGALKQSGYSQIDLIDYGVNVDFLANVYADENLIFGLFLGLGFGGNTLVGKYVRDVKRNLRDIVANDANLSSRNVHIKTQTTHFDFAINAGFRLNMGANHGVELMARVPLLPKSVYNSALTIIGKKNPNDNNDNTVETKYSTNLYGEVKPNHSIMVRYVFSF